MAKNILLKKDELISAVAEAAGETKVTVGKVLDVYGPVVVGKFQENPPKGSDINAIGIPGFGIMGTKNVPARKTPNNLTGKMTDVPAHIGASFKLSKGVKVSLNQDIIKKSVEEKAEKAEKAEKKRA